MTLATQTVGNGKPLVLIHGWGMNAGVWQPLLPMLIESYQVTMIELPGHGESEFVDGDINAWAQACLEVAPPKAIWLGWSLGAMVTLASALKSPQRVSQLVLAAGTPRFIADDDWQCGMQPELLEDFSKELFAQPQKMMLRFLGLQVRGAENERDTLRQLKAGVSQRPSATPEALKKGLDLLMHTNFLNSISQLGQSSLWIYGDRDTLVSGDTAACVTSLLPEANTMIIHGSGHAPFLSHPQQCLSAMESVL